MAGILIDGRAIAAQILGELAERVAALKTRGIQPGLAFVRILRPALYALLVASALLTFWAGADIGGRELPPGAAAAAPVLFAVFLVVFAVYRLALAVLARPDHS